MFKRKEKRKSLLRCEKNSYTHDDVRAKFYVLFSVSRRTFESLSAFLSRLDVEVEISVNVESICAACVSANLNFPCSP